MASQWRILPHLWISGLPQRGDTTRNGITAILSVNTQPTPPAVITELRHWHLPLQDGKHPSLSSLLTAAWCVEWWLSQGELVLVHCRAGRNRSAAVAALVVHHLRGDPGTAAIAHVRRCRPRALSNPAYVQLLEAL